MSKITILRCDFCKMKFEPSLNRIHEITIEVNTKDQNVPIPDVKYQDICSTCLERLRLFIVQLKNGLFK